MAYHQNSCFQDVEIHDVRDAVKAWEQAHAEDLARLAALVRRIVRAVGDHLDTKLEIRRENVGPLELRGQLADAGEALSPEVRLLWALKPSTPTQDDAEREDD